MRSTCTWFQNAPKQPGEKGTGTVILGGSMIVERFRVPASFWGYSVRENEKFGITDGLQYGLADLPAGTFGMKFLLANPALAALAMLPPIAGLSGGLLSLIHKVGAVDDAAGNVVAAPTSVDFNEGGSETRRTKGAANDNLQSQLAGAA
jgi:hypothetical protein